MPLQMLGRTVTLTRSGAMGKAEMVSQDVQARLEWAARDVVKGAASFAKDDLIMAEAWTRNAIELLTKAVEGMAELDKGVPPDAPKIGTGQIPVAER